MPLPAQPQVGDFGVVPIPGRGGRLIRIGQWLNGDGYADFEHAYVMVEPHRVVEAKNDGAGYSTLVHAGSLWYSCPEESREAVAREAVALIGVGYSWVDYFALAAVRFKLAWTSKTLRRYVTGSGEMICSQLVDAAYQRAGVQLFDDGRLPGDVTPGDLYGLILKQRAGLGV